MTIYTLVRFIVSPTITFTLATIRNNSRTWPIYTHGAPSGASTEPWVIRLELYPQMQRMQQKVPLVKLNLDFPSFLHSNWPSSSIPWLATFPTPLFHLIATSYHRHFFVFPVLSYTPWHDEKHLSNLLSQCRVLMDDYRMQLTPPWHRRYDPEPYPASDTSCGAPSININASLIIRFVHNRRTQQFAYEGNPCTNSHKNRLQKFTKMNSWLFVCAPLDSLSKEAAASFVPYECQIVRQGRSVPELLLLPSIRNMKSFIISKEGFKKSNNVRFSEKPYSNN